MPSRPKSKPRPPDIGTSLPDCTSSSRSGSPCALDYLLKPFSNQRFLAALERARQARARGDADALARAHDLLTRPQPAPLDRIFVRETNSVVPVPASEVERIEAHDDYVLVHRRQRPHLLSLRIGELEQRLTHPPFIWVHRSHIVNLDYVERMVGLGGSRFEMVMKNGALVPVSRARSQENPAIVSLMSWALRWRALTLNERTGRILSVLPIFLAG